MPFNKTGGYTGRPLQANENGKPSVEGKDLQVKPSIAGKPPKSAGSLTIIKPRASTGSGGTSK